LLAQQEALLHGRDFLARAALRAYSLPAWAKMPVIDTIKPMRNSPACAGMAKPQASATAALKKSEATVRGRVVCFLSIGRGAVRSWCGHAAACYFPMAERYASATLSGGVSRLARRPVLEEIPAKP
jgi:hypothetical protein